MLHISHKLAIPDQDIEIRAVRSRGAGGQNVNKVASAAHLRFDIRSSSLPAACKHRLLDYQDSRITRDGVVVIKADRFRTLEKNRQAALERLRALILAATARRPKRVATRVPTAAKRRRLEQKKRRGRQKAMRGRIDDAE